MSDSKILRHRMVIPEAVLGHFRLNGKIAAAINRLFECMHTYYLGYVPNRVMISDAIEDSEGVHVEVGLEIVSQEGRR